jgi:hypothetical protein
MLVAQYRANNCIASLDDLCGVVDGLEVKIGGQQSQGKAAV